MENKGSNALSLLVIIVWLCHAYKMAAFKLNIQFPVKNTISISSINFYEEDFSKQPTLKGSVISNPLSC